MDQVSDSRVGVAPCTPPALVLLIASDRCGFAMVLGYRGFRPAPDGRGFNAPNSQSQRASNPGHLVPSAGTPATRGPVLEPQSEAYSPGVPPGGDKRTVGRTPAGRRRSSTTYWSTGSTQLSAPTATRPMPFWNYRGPTTRARQNSYDAIGPTSAPPA